MNLADVLAGKVKVTALTSITYKGQVYRGEKAIKALAEKEVGNGNDSEPAATKPKTTRKRRSSRKAAEKPAEQPGDQS